MNHAALLTLLLPPVAYDRQGNVLTSELRAEGNALDAALESAGQVADGVTPFFAADLLPDWERVLAITPEAGASYQIRLQAVLAKIREQGGLSIPYFVHLASTLGYDIEIEEPEPFRAGESAPGDTLYIPEIIWTWVVLVHGTTFRQSYFRAGESEAGEMLLDFGEPVIEQTFQDLKPAWTFVSFEYPDLVTE